MATLAALQKQIEKLQQEAEQVRKTELAAVVAKVREAVAQYDLTPEDVFGGQRGSGRGGKKGASKAAVRAPRPPKYRDPKSGKTWSGMGKPPNWIAGVRNRDKFLIDASAAGEAASAAVPAAPAKKARKSAAVDRKSSNRAAKKPVTKKSTSASEAVAESSASNSAA